MWLEGCRFESEIGRSMWDYLIIIIWLRLQISHLIIIQKYYNIRLDISSWCNQISQINWSSRQDLVNSSLSLVTILGHLTTKNTVTTCPKFLWRVDQNVTRCLPVSSWRDDFMTRWRLFKIISEITIWKIIINKTVKQTTFWL